MGMERVAATRVVSDPDTKPEIVLKPSELWEYHKNRLEWLRKQRDVLVRSAKKAAERAVEHRVPEPSESTPGEADAWDALDATERSGLCESILSQLVERAGATADFVLKLLPQSIDAYVLAAVEERRKPPEGSGDQDAEDSLIEQNSVWSSDPPQEAVADKALIAEKAEDR